MSKLSKKKMVAADTAELDIQEDGLEDEIIDLVDLVEETELTLDSLLTGEEDSTETLEVETRDDNLEKIEEDLDISITEEEEREATLDEEIMESTVGISSGTPTNKNDEDLSFEAALLELFESTDSLAAKLIEESCQEEENSEESPQLEAEPSVDAATKLEAATEPSDERNGLEELIQPEDEHSESLFVNLELVKEDGSGEASSTQTAAIKPEPGVKSARTDWVRAGKYYPVAVDAIDKKMAEHKQEIEKLVVEKDKLQKIYEHLRSILYLQGEELKKAVTVIFAKYWSLKLSFMNPARRAGFNENILIKYYDKYILAKIKGTNSVSPPQRYIAQLWQDLYFSGLGANAVGALIVNYDTGSDPQDRSLAYAGEDQETLEDLIFIDSRVLFNLTTAIVNDHLSVEDAKRILFRKGRVEFDTSASSS